MNRRIDHAGLIVLLLIAMTIWPGDGLQAIFVVVHGLAVDPERENRNGTRGLHVESDLADQRIAESSFVEGDLGC
ncbi:hypothetical protein A5761_19225 [Mycolicibacterium setense]|uniref:hypothetical protein n=1 Tax=Mycolicibacterium setense TaxID=431269 RepID=UPI0007E95204|nr:hypothetical protein [Mycolicibacterium setense]OBB13765.1 hypothetical protein A5761_19225 [Mycolicibacterium setense]